jgi:hypothetical protein
MLASAETQRLSIDLHTVVHGDPEESKRARDRIGMRVEVIAEHVSRSLA